MKTHWPLLLTASLLFMAGAFRVIETNVTDVLSTVFLTAGSICLGAWLRDSVDADDDPHKKDEV